jgi:hypothetical protein
MQPSSPGMLDGGSRSVFVPLSKDRMARFDTSD